ncbi:hypothetical protein CQW23_25986 [Capsicum baccatum]|uniref:Uncharacterized protein n=1 Tax=Capsicum baccatum TaxID=33114 RepID=A0A2G2VMH8_CAPBA|nr:hypothetical protein CQW23_25986 [Capsicum baccatum]
MPKVKRFQNPLKSAHTPHDANGHSSSSTSTTLSHAIEASTSVQSPRHDASNPLLDDEVQQQEQAPIQPSNSSATSKSVPYWTVEIIDLEKTTTTVRVKVHDVNYLPLGEHIIVHFNEYGSTIGAAQGFLAGYCGTLAADCNVFPISFERWLGSTGVPKTCKEDCFETFLKSDDVESEPTSSMNIRGSSDGRNPNHQENA